MPWHRFGSGDVGWGMMGGGHPLMALAGLLFFLLLVALVVWAVVVLVRHGRRAKGAPAESAAPAPKGDDALEIARLRYARGEITRDEFVALRDELTK